MLNRLPPERLNELIKKYDKKGGMTTFENTRSINNIRNGKSDATNIRPPEHTNNKKDC
jgi:hypothetical protein